MSIVFTLSSLPEVGPTQEWSAHRTQLLALFNLDSGWLRSPLAFTSILAPLLTSLVAVFIPQLAQ